MRFLKCAYVVAALMTVISTTLAQQPEILWSQTFGGSSNDYGRCVLQTSDGGYIIAGYTESFGSGGRDIWLIKTDASGTEQWNQTYGGELNDYGRSVQQTSDGGYIIAGYTYSYGAGSSDVWLLKTNASGAEQWNQTYGDSLIEQSYCVQQTSDGGYILAGYTQTSGTGGNDVWLIKTDASGTEQWNQTYGGTEHDEGHCVQQTDDGGYVITGETMSYGWGGSSPDVWLIKTDSSGIEQWSQTYGGPVFDNGNCVQQTSDGGYIITGETYSYGAGWNDVYLLKTDASGTEQWSQTFGSPEPDCGNSVQLTSDGGYIIAGQQSRPFSFSDFYIIKTDALGGERWSMTFGGSSHDMAISIQQTSDGGFIAAGYTESFGLGEYDVSLIRLGTEIQPDLDVIMTPQNPPIVVPSSGGSFMFDVSIENTTASTLTADVWIEVITPGGTAIPVIARPGITFSASTTVSRLDLEQSIPPEAPEGLYGYKCSVGEVFVSATDYDLFTFEKEAEDGSAVIETGWILSGWEDEIVRIVRNPSHFVFYPPCPNPFNPATTIRYQLSEVTSVNLVIYDTAGRQVAELVNGWREAGVHEITFDASSLPSGVYFARLSAGELTSLQKLLLVK